MEMTEEDFKNKMKGSCLARIALNKDGNTMGVWIIAERNGSYTVKTVNLPADYQTFTSYTAAKTEFNRLVNFYRSLFTANGKETCFHEF
jgi:hypothetical protein